MGAQIAGDLGLAVVMLSRVAQQNEGQGGLECPAGAAVPYRAAIGDVSEQVRDEPVASLCCTGKLRERLGTHREPPWCVAARRADNTNGAHHARHDTLPSRCGHGKQSKRDDAQRRQQPSIRSMESQ